MDSMAIFYLSFQRPPPLSVRPSEPVKVCLTITNDLRSETFQPEVGRRALRLRLVWVLLVSSASRGSKRIEVLGEAGGGVHESEFEWRDASSAFKVVEGLKAPASLPRGRADGGQATLHLGVFVEDGRALASAETSRSRIPKGKSRRITGDELMWPLSVPVSSSKAKANDKERNVFFPVLSGPIHFNDGRQRATAAQLLPTGSMPGAKQNALLRIFRFTGAKRAEDGAQIEPVDVFIQEETGFELDKHIWDASLHLLRLLAHSSSAASKLPASLRLHDRLAARRGGAFNVVELGAGTAVGSIALAKWLQASPLPLDPESDEGPEVKFYGTDLASALPLMQINLNWNSLSGPTQTIDIDALPIRAVTETTSGAAASTDAAEAHPPSWQQQTCKVTIQPLVLDWTEPLPPELPTIDLILVSDCTYNPTFYPALARTVHALLSSHSSAAPAKQGPSGVGGSSTASCVLAKKHRHEDELGLWDVLREHGLGWTLLDGQEQSQTEDANEDNWGIWEVTLS
ncbi:hypothetical protein V8E36_009820 [Tilletia maclaganii]